MVDESGHDYEYGYDYLYEDEKPTDALDDAVDLEDEDNGPNDTYGEESVLAMKHIMQETNVKPLDLDIADDLHGMLIREAKARGPAEI